MQCPSCGNELKQGIQLCTWCGAKFRGLQRLAEEPPRANPPRSVPATSSVAPPKPASKTAGRIFQAILVLVALSVVGHFLPDTSTKLDAFQFSRDEVRAQLKAPSTANFDGYAEDRILDIGNGEYQVHGFVEAENALGVPLRQEWLTRVKYLGHHDWKTEHLELGDEVIEDDAQPSSAGDGNAAPMDEQAQVNKAANAMEYGGGRPVGVFPGQQSQPPPSLAWPAQNTAPSQKQSPVGEPVQGSSGEITFPSPATPPPLTR